MCRNSMGVDRKTQAGDKWYSQVFQGASGLAENLAPRIQGPDRNWQRGHGLFFILVGMKTWLSRSGVQPNTQSRGPPTGRVQALRYIYIIEMEFTEWNQQFMTRHR